MREIRLRINGIERELHVEDNETLLEALRNRAGVTSVKAACWRGECGLCTVLLNGRPVKSCSTLAVEADGKTVETAEGLYFDKRAKGLMESFVRNGATQCGFCTPAFVVASHALLLRNPKAEDEDIKEGLKGLICRCGTYVNMMRAVKEARQYYADGKQTA